MVLAVVTAWSGGSRDPLGKTLDAVKQQGGLGLHPALIKGWQQLYGFTSDSGGIRHAAHQETVEPTQVIAQYFLITCSAFVNLVTALKSQTAT
jgi:hypothetical protein